jgi:hypothetical protein
MPTDHEPRYTLESYAPALDDPHWWICHFHDAGAIGGTGLTITVSDEVLGRMTNGDLHRSLTSAEVSALDGQ